MSPLLVRTFALFRNGQSWKTPRTIFRFATSSSTPPVSITKAMDSTSSLVKDVVLFRDVKSARFIRAVIIFGTAQWFFWTFMAYSSFQFSYKKKKDGPEPTTFLEALKMFFDFQMCMAITYYTMGICAILFCVFLSYRTVKMVVLRKGGNVVTVVTYNPKLGERFIEVPVANTSAMQSRKSLGPKGNISLSIKGHRFFYLLSHRGEFIRPNLFDITVGLYRKF